MSSANQYVTKLRAVTPLFDNHESVGTSDTMTGAFHQKAPTGPQLHPMDVLEERYEIITCVGRGGMGAVYRAKDLRLGRDVAIKMLSRADRKATMRFMREAQTLALLKSPYLPTIYDRGRYGEQSFLVMEFVPGKPLSCFLSEYGPLHPSYAAQVLGDVLVALDCLHSKGLVHRDVKPANVIVSDNLRGTLVDLGIVWSSSDEPITSTGVIVGTPVYMSPEQYNQDPVDARTDLYSAGTLLYSMLTGYLPMQGCFELVGEVFRRQCHTLSSPWAEVVYRALEPFPSDRFSSALEMREAVFDALAATPMSHAVATPHQPDALVPQAPPKRLFTTTDE